MRSPFAAIAIGYLAVLSLPSFGAAVPVPPSGSNPKIPVKTEINSNHRYALPRTGNQHPFVAPPPRRENNSYRDSRFDPFAKTAEVRDTNWEVHNTMKKLKKKPGQAWKKEMRDTQRWFNQAGPEVKWSDIHIPRRPTSPTTAPGIPIPAPAPAQVQGSSTSKKASCDQNCRPEGCPGSKFPKWGSR